MGALWNHHFLQNDLEPVDAYLLAICGMRTAQNNHQKLLNCIVSMPCIKTLRATQDLENLERCISACSMRDPKTKPQMIFFLITGREPWPEPYTSQTFFTHTHKSWMLGNSCGRSTLIFLLKFRCVLFCWNLCSNCLRSSSVNLPTLLVSPYMGDKFPPPTWITVDLCTEAHNQIVMIRFSLVSKRYF